MAIDYCGGVPEIPKAGPVEIVPYPNSIKIIRGFSKTITIPFQDINTVSIKTDEQISSDVTLTRLLVLGIFAFGAKKKRKTTTSYLLIDYLANGIECTAVFTGESVPKVSSQIAKARQKYLAVNPVEVEVPPMQVGDVHSEIEKFYDLKEKGIISEEEFTAKKQQLLNI